MNRGVGRDSVEPILPPQAVRAQRASSRTHARGGCSLRSPRSARKWARRSLAPPEVHGPDARPKLEVEAAHERKECAANTITITKALSYS